MDMNGYEWYTLYNYQFAPESRPFQKETTRMSMELSNYLVSWVVTCLGGLTTYLYRGSNLFTRYHGHPSCLPTIHFHVF